MIRRAIQHKRSLAEIFDDAYSLVQDMIDDEQPGFVLKLAVDKIQKDHGKRIAQRVTEMLHLAIRYPEHFHE